jgi:hypothetical protein
MGFCLLLESVLATHCQPHKQHQHTSTHREQTSSWLTVKQCSRRVDLLVLKIVPETLGETPSNIPHKHHNSQRGFPPEQGTNEYHALLFFHQLSPSLRLSWLINHPLRGVLHRMPSPYPLNTSRKHLRATTLIHQPLARLSNGERESRERREITKTSAHCQEN